MWPYYPDLLATPVPRYTSYPTAAEFNESVGADDMGAALARLDAGSSVSLYLHIPYCHEICWYCGCNTGAANRATRLAAYVERLGQEIDLIGAALAGRGIVRHIAWGGGSPNALSPDQFTWLAHKVRLAFVCDRTEQSIELDPRGFNDEWADQIARHGITRASLGVQTFAPHIQRAIGRVQPYDDIASTCCLLRQAGITSLNFDLMYGLPSQSDADLVETLEAAIDLGPDRLAVFGYAHVPHLLPRQRRIDAASLPNGAARFAQAWLAHEQLITRGYRAVGFDHFAKPGDALARAAREMRLHRNFQGFTDDPSHCLIGLGASAISCFPDLIVQNEKNTGRYHARIGSGALAATRGVRPTRLDRQRAEVIEALLCHGEAECGQLLDLQLLRDDIAPFEAIGLARWHRTKLVLTADALPYARTIAATFDRFRKNSKVQFSSAI
ncbi:oxygen-independent coproporphyrinogen-3 oxidase [Sphingomonas vulcanisoli]|uniref:Coproporphyrinogen-III oxidase n=1 Tax=Sphingomonas vulcanisoli TaxID=1658060 RepID=A0ABX0TYT6_9SPHN|nr:oxygen-independent coproporphyrinogen III oxidase [Sphingomonas vulcanisoli]NIJ09379.1 oxygen-independent coproporphyrinogen-3 oxidase [Sphingomonas vulcanisoli]